METRSWRAAGAVYAGSNRFLTFADNGQVAFLGALRGGGLGEFNQALFMTDLDGPRHVVARTGALMEVV